MVRAIRLHALGGPEVLQIDTIDLPPPAEGELRLRVHAIGLNRAEAMFRAGHYLDAPQLPARIGYEAAGTVLAIGPGVTGFAAGDAVSVIPGFSMNRYGTYGDEILVPAAMTVKHPDALSFEQAAAVWMQYLTAYGALIDIAAIKPGDAVVINAASSSVGLAAIQIANAAGALSIATTRTGQKRDALLGHGARHVVATAEQDTAAEIRRLTGGLGARVVFDPVAGPGVAKLAEAMAPGGIMLLYGALSSDTTPFPLFPALGGGLTLRGYTVFEIVQNPERLDQGRRYVLDGLTAGTLRPVIDMTFPFEQIVEAHRYMESNEQIGKIVVTVG